MTTTMEAAAKATLSGASWLPVVEPHLAPCLVDPLALERLRPLCSRLPSTSLYALEVRLASASRQVDLSCRIDRPKAARQLAEESVAGPAARLLQAWAKADVWQAVPELWLEYDFPQQAQPSGHGTWSGPMACLRLAAPLDQDVMRGLLEDATDAILPPRLDLLTAAIGPPLRLLYVFDLSARAVSGVRLEIYCESFAPLIAYLERYGPEGGALRVAALEPLLGDADRFHLSLDVLQDGVSSRLGLEASYRRLPHREPRWSRMLGRLCAAGLCTEEERRGLEGWPGYDRADSVAGWPRGAAGFCVRCLSHVKVVTTPHQPPHAKAYLLFQHLSQKVADVAGARARSERPATNGKL